MERAFVQSGNKTFHHLAGNQLQIAILLNYFAVNLHRIYYMREYGGCHANAAAGYLLYREKNNRLQQVFQLFDEG
jgi:hypothetical protein